MSTQHPAPTQIDDTEAHLEATCSPVVPLPAGPWALYVAERRLGIRRPPSVATWRPEDERRQAAMERGEEI